MPWRRIGLTPELSPRAGKAPQEYGELHSASYRASGLLLTETPVVYESQNNDLLNPRGIQWNFLACIFLCVNLPELCGIDPPSSPPPKPSLPPGFALAISTPLLARRRPRNHDPLRSSKASRPTPAKPSNRKAAQTLFVAHRRDSDADRSPALPAADILPSGSSSQRQSAWLPGTSAAARHGYCSTDAFRERRTLR